MIVYILFGPTFKPYAQMDMSHMHMYNMCTDENIHYIPTYICKWMIICVMYTYKTCAQINIYMIFGPIFKLYAQMDILCTDRLTYSSFAQMNTHLHEMHRRIYIYTCIDIYTHITYVYIYIYI